jgi:hypothetical protein
MILLLPMKIQIISVCVFGKVNFAPKGTCSVAVSHKIRTDIRA